MCRPALLCALLSALLVACGPKPAAQSASTQPDPPAAAGAEETPAPGGEHSAEIAADEPPVAAVPDGKFRVVLFRKARVGERVRLTRTVSDLTSQRVIQNGKVVKNQTLRQHVEFEAVTEVLAVTVKGRPSRTRYTIKRFAARMGRGMKPIFKPGTVLTVQRGGKAERSITSSAGPLSKEQLAAAKLVISLRKSRANDQEIFGTSEPRAIGESWPINSKRGKQSMEEEGIAKLRSLNGKTTLVAERQVEGVPCLEVLGRMEADIEHLPGLPKDTKVVRGKLRARLTGLFPTDPKLLPPKKTSSMTFDVVSRTTSPKGIMELHLSTQRDGQTRMRPVR